LLSFRVFDFEKAYHGLSIVATNETGELGVKLGELGSNLANVPHVGKEGDILDEPHTAE
jgi:hypothetical protein